MRVSFYSSGAADSILDLDPAAHALALCDCNRHKHLRCPAIHFLTAGLQHGYLWARWWILGTSGSGEANSCIGYLTLLKCPAAQQHKQTRHC